MLTPTKLRRKRIAVNAVESNPLDWCNLSGGMVGSMLREFYVAPSKRCWQLFFIYFLIFPCEKAI